MSINNEWEFLLTSPSLQLRSCAHLNNPYFFVYEESDSMNDCWTNRFKFQSAYCDNESDQRIVWQIGYELLSLFNGACLLFDKNFSKEKIEELSNDGDRQEYCPDNGLFNFLEKPEDTNILGINNHHLSLLNKATEDVGIYLILKYFDMGQNWLTYYKILESVEELSKNENIILNIESDAKRRFHNVANNYSLSNIHARHGFKKNQKTNRTPIMDINEAHTFIRHVAKQYVNQKMAWIS